MGRRRKDGDPLGLAGTRLVFSNGRFFYRHRGKPERWENVGTDIASAKRRAALYNDPHGLYGTVGYWLDQFVVDMQAMERAGIRSQRTVDDYAGYCEDDGPLKAGFGAMLPEDVKPSDVQAYLDFHAKLGRPTQANREKACLSAMLSWLMVRPDCPSGLKINPCMRHSGVKRNPESKRERYVTHEEYRAVYEVANSKVRLMMELVYRTLQRPEVDVLKWTPANIKVKAGDKVLHFKQSKTGRTVDIALSGQLGALIEAAVGEVPKLRQPIVHTLTGEAYTYDGISAMLKQAQEKAQVDSFGFRDLKGKGATDMWLNGEPIERIQLLCGHADKRTTEIYIKARWRETAAPNDLEVNVE
jgi:integrase